MEDILRYPIGNFSAPVSYTEADFKGWIADIKALPQQVRDAVMGMTDDQLNTPYRPGGWTIKQVVHHIADSHLNCIIRFKLALTEDNPTIKPYAEAEWAQLADYRLPVESSLKMLEGIHQHMAALFESLTAEQWERTFFHPEHQKSVSLKRNLALYAWHGKHHLAHIVNTFNV